MGTNRKFNNETQLAADQALADGFIKHAATLATLLIAGSTVPTTQLVTVLQARVAAIKAALTARTAMQMAFAAARDEIAKTAALVSGARQALKVAFAGQIDTLGDFGLKPRKTPAPRTPEEKALAAAKAKATRAARGTKGPKQKAKIKGNVTAAPAAAPATTPAAPTTPKA